MTDSHSPKRSGQAGLDPGCFALEILRGQTRNPLRPIEGDRFLIGSGKRCDLRLGGTDMPPLHSILHVENDHVWIDTVQNQPLLEVEGETCSAGPIYIDEVFRIGSFELAIRKGLSISDELVDDTDEFEDEHESDILNQLPELSALELIELIEAEDLMIEEFEERKKLGAAALMNAVQLRVFPTETEEDVIECEPDAVEEPDTVKLADAPEWPLVARELVASLNQSIASLNRFAMELERRAAKLTDREVQHEASSLLDYQQEIIGRLDEVLVQLSGHSDDHGGMGNRNAA